MKVEVSLNGAGPVIRSLNGAASKIQAGWKREAFKVGERATRLMKSYRRGGTDSTRTAVRSGVLLNAYGSKVVDAQGGVDLVVGAILPSDRGQVPRHARIHEGYDASGRQVSRFVIRAKNAAYLTFPIRRGGGLAKSNIVAWARVKQVILYPRPAIEPVGRDIPDALRASCTGVFVDALRAA